MRITGWHVDGYGRFHDRGWTDLPGGLTIVHGPNEAGKSTLLSFLRSMLFGLKGQHQRDPAIRPLAGGEHGGRLWLADARDRTWTVHRHRPGGLRLEGPDGDEQDEAMLTALLGGVGRDVFEAVFAFSLSELERLDGLGGEALRGQLFAATLTGGGSTAHAALDAVQERIDRLYRARKSSPLRAFDDRLKELRRERTAAIQGAARHAELRAEERLRVAEHEALRARTAGMRGARERLERLERLWAQLDPLRQARAERDGLADGPVVPDDAVERANGLVERRASLIGSLDVVRERAATRRADPLAAPDARLLAVADEVEDRAAEIPSQRDRTSALPELRAAVRRAAAGAIDAVADLGPGWDAARVVAVDVSHPTRQGIRGLAEQAATADAERLRAARERTDARERLRAAGERVAQAARAAEDERADGSTGDDRDPAGRPGSGGAVESALAALPDLRAAFADRATRRRGLRAEEEALERVRAAAPRAGEPTVATDGVRVSALVLVAAVAVVVGVVLVVAGQPLGGAAVVVLGIVVAIVDRTAGTTGDGPDVARDARAAHAGRVREQEARVAAERRDLAEAEGRLADAAARAGIDPAHLVDAPTSEPIERHAARLADERTRIRTAQQAAATLARARDDHDRARAEHDRRATAHEAAAVDLDRIVASWETRRDAAGLPVTAVLRDAPELLEAVRRAAAALREEDAATARLADGEAACDAWSTAVDDLLRRAGRAASSGRPADPTPSGDHARPTDHERPADHAGTIDALSSLRIAVREAVGLRAAVRERERDDERDDAESRELRRRAEATGRELAELLAVHRVDDVDGLRAARDLTRRRARLEQRIDDGEAAVRRDAGAGPDGDALIAEARTGTVVAWATRQVEIDAELPRIDDEYRLAVAAATEAAAARRALEDAVDLPRIDTETEQVRTDAARAMREYRTLLRTKELIEGTLDAFVRDQQPAVLRDASTLFARVTDGRYTEVRQALTGGGRGGRDATLRVLTAAGESQDPAVLSRGTREQLYLCLRLALARGTAGRTGALPLVMDDVLVNFSPDRARAVADAVAAVAREQQVLFFTCHPATRDLLLAAAHDGGDPGTRVEELTR